jgi:hypothetical protein
MKERRKEGEREEDRGEEEREEGKICKALFSLKSSS